MLGSSVLSTILLLGSWSLWLPLLSERWALAPCRSPATLSLVLPIMPHCLWCYWIEEKRGQLLICMGGNHKRLYKLTVNYWTCLFVESAKVIWKITYVFIGFHARIMPTVQTIHMLLSPIVFILKMFQWLCTNSKSQAPVWASHVLYSYNKVMLTDLRHNLGLLWQKRSE